MTFSPWMLLLLLLASLLITACVAPSGDESSIAAVSPSPRETVRSEPTVMPTATPQQAQDTARTTPIPTATPSASRTGVTCGNSACPPGWNCCGAICYNPVEEPNLYCDKGTLRQNISKHTCADIQCNGLPCCNDYMHGPTCYNPEVYRCGWA